MQQESDLATRLLQPQHQCWLWKALGLEHHGPGTDSSGSLTASRLQREALGNRDFTLRSSQAPEEFSVCWEFRAHQAERCLFPVSFPFFPPLPLCRLVVSFPGQQQQQKPHGLLPLFDIFFRRDQVAAPFSVFASFLMCCEWSHYALLDTLTGAVSSWCWRYLLQRVSSQS